MACRCFACTTLWTLCASDCSHFRAALRWLCACWIALAFALVRFDFACTDLVCQIDLACALCTFWSKSSTNLTKTVAQRSFQEVLHELTHKISCGAHRDLVKGSCTSPSTGWYLMHSSHKSSQESYEDLLLKGHWDVKREMTLRAVTGELAPSNDAKRERSEREMTLTFGTSQQIWHWEEIMRQLRLSKPVTRELT